MSSEQRLIVAILRDADGEEVLQALLDNEFRVTRIASTGGFLRRGMTTLMIGVEDEKVDQAIRLIGETCDSTPPQTTHNATMFVLKVDEFLQV